jgi:hypothetical protein
MLGRVIVVAIVLLLSNVKCYADNVVILSEPGPGQCSSNFVDNNQYYVSCAEQILNIDIINNRWLSCYLTIAGRWQIAQKPITDVWIFTQDVTALPSYCWIQPGLTTPHTNVAQATIDTTKSPADRPRKVSEWIACCRA